AWVGHPPPPPAAAPAAPLRRTLFCRGSGLYAAERPFQAVASIGRQHGFVVISLLESFRRAANPARPLFRSDDIHHTAEGARVMADGIAAGLLEAGLVPRCPR